MNSPNQYTLSARAMDGIFGYLVSRPHNEVDQLIQLLRSELAPQVKAAQPQSTPPQLEVAPNAEEKTAEA